MLRAPPANEAESWPLPFSAATELCENELENSADDEGGRRGECAATMEPLLSDMPPARALNEVESGEGRLGDEAKPPAPLSERPKPAEGEPATTAAGGPYGSRSGDEAKRLGEWREPDWRDAEIADLMGTG
jgi:hypothetical protein